MAFARKALITIVAIVGTFYYLLTDNAGYLPLFYITLGHIVLGMVVYSHNRRNNINISYLFLVFFAGAMAFNSAVLFNAKIFASILLGAKLIYASSFLLMIPLFYFSTFFPFERPKLSFLQKLMVPIPGVILSILTLFSGLMVRDVILKPWGRDVVFGPLFPLFVVYCAFYVGYAFAVLIHKHRLSSGLQKTQIRYIFISFLIIGLPNFTANIILPSMFGNYRFIEPSLYFALPGAALVAYAILKHRLMSIEVVIQRSTVYGIATVLVLALYALAVIISETFFRKIMGYTSLIITAAAALLIAVLYQPLVRSLQNFTDRLFFRGRYDYQKTLREISHKIASVIKLEELSKLIISSFIDTMKVSEISFLLLEKEKEHFRSVPLSLPLYKKIEIDIESPIVSRLSATKDLLVRDEIEDLVEVRDEMERLGISIWVPIISKEELIGIIALGNKLSGDVFTAEDIGLLSTLASQTAVALDNARLYDEVVNMKDYSEEILQSMVNGVLTVDTKSRIVTFNQMAEKVTGRGAADVLGKICEEIWGKRGAIPKVIENTLKRGRGLVNFEAGIASPKRGLVPVSFSSTILRNHQKKKIGALLTIQDLSEVKMLEEKVRRADKLAALATMAAGMAHEIKNPLSSMKILSQLLPQKFEDPEYRNKIREIIPREIDRIDRIVESLLGFARSTALNFEKMDIKEILEDNLKYYEDKAKAADVKIIRNYEPLPEIEVDKGQLSQVFSNLILNAIQAMSGGGELEVAIIPGKKIDDILQNVKIRFSDTGHGISEDMAKKLFDPFFTTKYGGTGLGLTISHSIVDGHKGYIDVESKVGKGTVFTVTLPVSQGLI
jgi:PAS domain S-box-containing protein